MIRERADETAAFAFVERAQAARQRATHASAVNARDETRDDGGSGSGDEGGHFFLKLTSFQGVSENRSFRVPFFGEEFL